jgi:hypothetical protein
MWWFINKKKLKEEIKQEIKDEILVDIKQNIIPCIVAEVLHQFSQTEDELDKILQSHSLVNNIRI